MEQPRARLKDNWNRDVTWKWPEEGDISDFWRGWNGPLQKLLTTCSVNGILPFKWAVPSRTSSNIFRDISKHAWTIWTLFSKHIAPPKKVYKGSKNVFEELKLSEPSNFDAPNLCTMFQQNRKYDPFLGHIHVDDVQYMELFLVVVINTSWQN